MNCRGVSRRLSAYIDDELSPGIRQGMEEHLQLCPSCKYKLSEYQAIVNAAHNLVPLAASEGLTEGILKAVRSRQETRQVLSKLRYRLTLAGVAFMTTSAAIFFLVGPPASKVATNLAGAPDSLNIDTANPPDFWTHPETKVASFPIPEGGVGDSQLVDEQNMVPADSATRPNEFILPNVQKVNENIDGKF